MSQEDPKPAAKRRAPRKRPADAPVEPLPETAAPEPKPFDGVFVLRMIADDGSVETKVVPQGDVRFSEVETILGLGLKGWRQQIGV